jgi:DNA-binding NarL/FixJ family response regulator
VCHGSPRLGADGAPTVRYKYLRYQQRTAPRVVNRVKISLTPREQQLLQLVREGLSNRDIAARLGIKEQTVKNALAVLYEKCGVRNRTQLAVSAVAVVARHRK